MARIKKECRQRMLLQEVKEKPFLTDEKLAAQLGVSVQTIRLDRIALGIPELRERVKKMAESAQSKIRSISSGEIVGELIDLELGQSGISVMTVTEEMVFERTHVARGHHVFSQANSLALAVMDAATAVTGVANIKYKIPIRMGDRLVAKAEVVRKRGNKHFIWVKTHSEAQEVFRAKFIMVALDDGGT